MDDITTFAIASRLPNGLADKSVDDQLKEYQKGGSKFERWQSGDPEAIREREVLYRRKYPGEYQIE